MLHANKQAQPSVPPTRAWARRLGLASVGLVALALAANVVPSWRYTLTSSQIPVSREYVTQRAEHATIELPDGSRAVLAPETRLSYRASDGIRTVTLSGHAFFTVDGNATRPFVVHAGPATVRVLGTTFDVRHYRADEPAQIAVVSGKVEAAGRRGTLVLTSGMAARMTDSATIGGTYDVTSATDWARGRLTFKDTPVRAMLESAGRWYGYDFRVADSTLLARHVTVSFLIDKPNETLKTLCAILDVTLTIDGSVVTLHPARSTTKKRVSPSSPGSPAGPDLLGDPASSFHTPSEVGK